jgi:hypothetical protein
VTWPDIDADAGTCQTCGRQIFRTNLDGHWHHAPYRDDTHDPEPAPPPCDACAAAGVMCGLTAGERYCDGSPADDVDTPI